MISFFVVLKIRENRIIAENKLVISFNRKIIYMLIIMQFVTYYIFPIWIAFVVSLILFLILLIYFRKVYISIICKLLEGIKHEKK